MDRNQIGVTSSLGSLSPYMNFDPAYLAIDSEPQFIMPEGANQRRGRFELAFSQIGGSVCVGAGIGGASGLYTGLQETRTAQIMGAVRRTQILNFITKKGASSAQSLGVIALIYSIFGVALSKGRGADDEINTMAAATATGLLYKSADVYSWGPGALFGGEIAMIGHIVLLLPSGLQKSLRGGAVGFGLAAIYCVLNHRDHVKKIVGIRD